MPQKKVNGYFSCSNNRLTSLEGAPEEVGGDFDCRENGSMSLEGAPKKVGGSFICVLSRLTSLEGAPEEVGGNFDCSYNRLTSLEGAPEEVGSWFDCSHNKLTSLEGAPKKVGRVLRCEHNPLTSLRGVPKEVEGLRLCETLMFGFGEFFDNICKERCSQKARMSTIKALAEKIYETLKTRERIDAFYKSAGEKLETIGEALVLIEACSAAAGFSDYALANGFFSSKGKSCSEEKNETKSDKDQNLALILKLREGMTR